VRNWSRGPVNELFAVGEVIVVDIEMLTIVRMMDCVLYISRPLRLVFEGTMRL
jgi:hypothetical protein